MLLSEHLLLLSIFQSLGDYMDAYGERVEQGDGDPGHDKPGGTSGTGHNHDDQPAGLHSHNWEVKL